MKKCSFGNVTAVYIGKPSDFIVKDGEVRMKRKYGKKFPRKVIKLEVNKDEKV